MVFCLYEYFKTELQIQASVTVRNEALLDLTPAVEIWLIWLCLQNSSGCSNIASWCSCQTKTSYLQCWCFIVPDWNWIMLFWVLMFFLSLFVYFFLWPQSPQGPITNQLCSLKMPRHQLEYLTGWISTLQQHTFQKNKSWIWQQQFGEWISVCKQIVGSRDDRLFRTVFTSSSSLSSCTGMLAHITLRNASSSIIPAGPHFLAQSDTGYTCSIQYTLFSNLHAFIARETCTPSKCSYPSAFFPPGTCMCMQMYLC